MDVVMVRSVVQVCEDSLDHEELLKDCSGFLTAVAKEFGYGDVVRGDANGIRAKFANEVVTKEPFHFIGKNPDLATEYAGKGHLVLGGLTSSEMTYKDKSGREHKASMGHVVIVVPGGPSKPGKVKLADGREQPVRGGYPYCYQGAANRPYRLKERTQVDLVFPSVCLRDVIYAWLEVKQ
jgi:hypothetical protein